MPAVKALVFRFLSKKKRPLVAGLSPQYPLSFSSFVGARDLEISPFDQENRRLLSKLYSSKNLKVFRKVENRS